MPHFHLFSPPLRQRSVLFGDEVGTRRRRQWFSLTQLLAALYSYVGEVFIASGALGTVYALKSRAELMGLSDGNQASRAPPTGVDPLFTTEVLISFICHDSALNSKHLFKSKHIFLNEPSLNSSVYKFPLSLTQRITAVPVYFCF